MEILNVCSMSARTPAYCFSRKCLCFCFSRSLKSIKRAMRKVQTIVFFSKYHQNDFLYGAKIPRREALAGDNLALPLIFILWKICPVDHLKAQKNWGCWGSFLTLCNFVFSSSISNLFLWIFFLSKGIRRAQICLTVQQILGNFIKRRDQSCSKDLYVLCRKTVRSGIELRIWACVNFQLCHDLSPPGNLSHGVFFSVDPFFRRRRPVNITGVVSGKPRLHYIKTVKLLLTHLFK